MKHLRFLPLLLACSLSLVGAADDYTVDWHRIGQGGGTSANEEFTVSGVMGDPVAAPPAVADEFTVTGGFGVVTVLPTEGAPALTITPAADGSVRVAWPLPDAGWELRQSAAPDGLAWEKPLEPLQDDGAVRFIGVTPTAGTRFYRLFAADPSGPDQDGDGIPDDLEADFGFDPQEADTDRDGVPDGLEDAEGDGLPNAWELRHGFNPFARDSDANGVEDGAEDSDDVRLTNLREAAAGTHPRVHDSDGNGFNDEAEVTAGSAPLQARSRPQPFAVSGGAIVIASAVSIQHPGGIYARGGRGGGSYQNQGSGGSIRLVAPSVTGTGILWTESPDLWARGIGRVRIDSLNLAGFAFNHRASYSAGANMIARLPVEPSLRIVQAAGTDLAPAAQGVVRVVLPPGAPAEQPLRIQARGFNAAVPIRVTLYPENAAAIELDDVIDNTQGEVAVKELTASFPVNTPTRVMVWTRPGN